MKLVSYLPQNPGYDPQSEVYALRQSLGRGGILQGDQIYDLSAVSSWLQETKKLKLASLPGTVLDFVSLAPEERQALIEVANDLSGSGLESKSLKTVRL